MSAGAVIFSELSRLYTLGGGLDVYDIMTRKCFRTPGKIPKEIAHLDCEEIPHHLFGETLKDFVAKWKTQDLPREAVKKEIALWGSFFTSPRTVSHNPRIMSIQRSGEEFSFLKAEIVGEGNQIANVSKSAFDKEATEEVGQDKVKVYNQQDYWVWDPIQSDNEAVQRSGIDKKALSLFSLASVYRMSRVDDVSGRSSSRHFIK